MRTLAAIFLYLGFIVTAWGQPQTLVLGVHPYLPVAEIKTRFGPLAQYLARVTGHPVSIRVGRTYAEHIDAVGANSVDIAYMGPVPYVKLIAAFGPRPLLARQEIDHQPYLYGVVFVRQDSPIKTLADLKGKRFAFGDPDSTMSHVLPLRMLENAGVAQAALAQIGFLGAHKNVALAVLVGDYDAGGVKREVFEEMANKGLRALATSPPVADHAFVCSTKLTPELQTSLRTALLELRDSTEGKAIMAAIHPGMTALVPAIDSDYDNLRTLMGVKLRP